MPRFNKGDKVKRISNIVENWNDMSIGETDIVIREHNTETGIWLDLEFYGDGHNAVCFEKID